MSLGTSPTAPSLLIPSNPAFSPVETAPKGGILINVHRASEPTLSIDSSLGSYNTHARRPSDPSSIISEKEEIASSYSHSPIPSPISGIHTPNVNAKSLKIRFAPLPDPRRPRSLSTGRNIAWTNQVDENGDEKRQLSIKDHTTPDDDECAVQDDSDEEEQGGEEDEGDGKSGRRWSKSMGLSSSWKVSKKLLTGKNPIKDKEKDKEDSSMSYPQGAPLKKSVSTGGFIGSSPFRWTSETERKNSMQGSSPPTVTSFLSSRSNSNPNTASGHRRNSSLEPGTGSSYSSRLSSSPSTTPIKMMNGRVYGSRRASEAAERERRIREKNEPAFVEWGQGQVAQRTTEEPSGKGGFLGDNDDGGGMAWVKRRREERERQKREKEEQEKLQSEQGLPEAQERENGKDGVGVEEALSTSSSSSTSSLDLNLKKSALGINTGDLKTPAIAISELPPTPIIRVSADSDNTSNSPSTNSHGQSEYTKSTMNMDVGPKGERMTPTPPNVSSEAIHAPKTLVDERKEGDHVVQAMRIPSGTTAQKSNKLKDPFAQESQNNDNPSDEEEEEEDEEEEDEDDGDFDDDEEEEIDIRTTSSAAGVEVISRHK
ncbi:hypothetical protein V865_003560 [Kwoniella europaea PYCC6329]|uniref:Uncharacterized protein n=1 Tax=Kwoniella europaea PYCC6329 TaxID=1423913 RepID=A0AAX4KJL4_9TREE